MGTEHWCRISTTCFPAVIDPVPNPAWPQAGGIFAPVGRDSFLVCSHKGSPEFKQECRVKLTHARTLQTHQ